MPVPAAGSKGKVDPKNPYNESGKIVKVHPKYYEVLGRVTKATEDALNELQFKNVSKARELMKQALEQMEQLED